MDLAQLLIILTTAIANSTPLILACMGETITEQAGVINLSAEGTILLGAMTGFAVAKITGNLLLGFAGAAFVGAAIALVLAFIAITLKQSQVAVGFVLALLCSDLSSFLGSNFVRVPGPTVPSWNISIAGLITIQGDLLVYSSYFLIAGTWFYFYCTRSGLMLRAIGEQPLAAFARGVNVVQMRYAYTLIGGALMGIAGAAFSLDFKAGWSDRHTAGYGWIVLAIVIFGGWRPLKVALGAYLFGILQSLASVAQSYIPQIPSQVFNVAPFVLMILVLVLTSGDWLDRLLGRLPVPRSLLIGITKIMRSPPPASLGKIYSQD
jgi:general nucleoside transport system permease protein